MYQLLTTFLDPDQATLIIIMLASIPLSYTLSLLSNKHLILALSITMSIVFQCIMFPTEKYFLWSQQIIVYLLLKFGPRKQIGFIVIAETMLNLAIIQIRRMYISYGVNGVDITGILMMQTFLYVGLAYNYQNGLKSDEQLTQDAQKRKVINLPDPLTYVGFVFFLPASLIGPCFEFRDFEDYINRKGDYQKIPTTIKPAARQLAIFVFSLSVYAGTMFFDIWKTVLPQFAQHSYWYKMLYICGVIFHIEYKYITAWSLGMISIHASGISYRKHTNTFDKIQVNRIFDFFFNPSLKIKIESWNISIQVALKRYIYDQVYDAKAVYPDERSRKKAQAIAQRNTLFTSAIWHGFYPGYFLSFFHWMIYLRMTQQLFRLRKINKAVDNLWIKYKFGIIENLMSNFVFMYFGIFLHVMTWANIKALLSATYGIPFFILYGLYFVIYEAEILTKHAKKKTQRSNSNKSGKTESSQDQTSKDGKKVQSPGTRQKVQ